MVWVGGDTPARVPRACLVGRARRNTKKLPQKREACIPGEFDLELGAAKVGRDLKRMKIRHTAGDWGEVADRVSFSADRARALVEDFIRPTD